jgi:hypothetical protein
LAEQLEARLARGEQIDIQEHALLVSTMVRVAQRIGVDRVPRDVVPCLAEYLHQGRPSESAPDAGRRNDDLSTRLPQAQETEP